MGPVGLVWMFKAHRELYLSHQSLLRDLDARDRQVAALESALQTANRRGSAPDDMLSAYTAQALVEEPFKDGKIPDNMWLTPADPAVDDLS